MKIPGVCSTLTTVLLLCVSAFSQSTTSAPKTSTPAKQPASRPAAAKQSAPSAPKADTKLPTEQTVNEFMRRMFGYDSTIRWKVLQITPSEVPNVAQVTISIGNDQQRPWTLYIAPDGQHAFVGEVIPFGADPFAVARKDMEIRAKGPSRGPQNAAVTIVEFSDLQCPHCKQAQPTLEKLISEVPNARLVFENFPIDQIHKWANLAARYGSCIGRTNGDSFWRFIDGVFNEQDQITEQNPTSWVSQMV
jgi:protein-disulfide isomerase